jgi:hypothetical protein
MEGHVQSSNASTHIPSDQRLEIRHLRFYTRILKLRRDESHQVVQIWPGRHPVCWIRHVGLFSDELQGDTEVVQATDGP